jgi:hypothetical protein
MSINPEYDGTLTLRPYPNGVEGEPVAALAVDHAPPAAPAVFTPPAQVIEPSYFPAPAAAPAAFAVATPASSRPRWIAPLAVAVIGIIASGALGYLLYSTTGQRDSARHQLASTQVMLTSTQDRLTSAQSEAAARQLTADYVALYIAGAARVLTDDEAMNVCKGYSQCRTAAQQTLNDMQAFQADRTKATVPAALANSDAMLGDALSAGIAAVQEVITGMDNNNFAKIKDGWTKLDKSMLSIGKAESALGVGLR